MIDYQKDSKNIVTITMDMPNSPANILNESLTPAFTQALQQLQSENDLAGVIIASAKKDWIAGADLQMLLDAKTPDKITAFVTPYKQLIRTLETLGKPVVAAINGSALGGGYELALGCHYRIAINEPKAKIGLPEATLGVFPGAGGTQRLPRLIGIQAALPLLLEGKQLSAEAALQAGLVDALAINQQDCLQQARDWIVANPKPVQAWDQKGFKWPGGNPNSPAVQQVLAVAPNMLKKKTQGNYPHLRAILACVQQGSALGLDDAIDVETRYFAHIVASQTAKNMIGTFWFQLNNIKKGASRPDDVPAHRVQKVGLLGAGMMGAGIAYVAARSGITVVLKDIDQAAAERGKRYSAALLDKQVSRKKLSREKADEVLSRIQASSHVQDLADCDLVIEAVFEDRTLKSAVTKETEAVLDSTAIFASNTSTLPITGLAEASVRPEQFIGLHFFSPVDKMPLVEIIKGEKTNPETLAKAFDFVLQIKKTPIVVNDSRGFYTSRVFATYVNEGIAMLGEGQHPRRIEMAGLKAGMPVGPLALNDEVSLSLSLHIIDQSRKDMAAAGEPPRPEHPAEIIIRHFVEDLDRPGKKAGKGFYDYPDADNPRGKKHLWPGLLEEYPLAEPYNEETMMDRMLYIQAIETLRCVDEGVLESVADANIGSIFGWGFAPMHGGTLQFIESIGGVEVFTQRAKQLAAEHGERFVPPNNIAKLIT